MNKEDCKGCRTNSNTGNCIWLTESLVCPCASCLIKVMCINKCDLLQDHTTKINELEGTLTLHIVL